MMSECDPTETESSEPVLESNFHSTDRPNVLFDRNRIGLGLAANPGVAVRISDSRESVLTELETDGSGEEALLLPCLAGSSSSPRGVREKRSRRNRHSSSSDKDTLASPGNWFDQGLWNLITAIPVGYTGGEVREPAANEDIRNQNKTHGHHRQV